MQYLVDLDDLSIFNEIFYQRNLLFFVTKAVVAQNVKDTERKWIAHGWNHR